MEASAQRGLTHEKERHWRRCGNMLPRGQFRLWQAKWVCSCYEVFQFCWLPAVFTPPVVRMRESGPTAAFARPWRSGLIVGARTGAGRATCFIANVFHWRWKARSGGQAVGIHCARSAYCDDTAGQYSKGRRRDFVLRVHNGKNVLGT